MGESAVDHCHVDSTSFPAVSHKDEPYLPSSLHLSLTLNSRMLALYEELSAPLWYLAGADSQSNNE